MAIDLDCPNCGTSMRPEHAHAICPACRFIHPCCDGAPQPALAAERSADRSKEVAGCPLD